MHSATLRAGSLRSVKSTKGMNARISAPARKKAKLAEAAKSGCPEGRGSDRG
ncbi:hypothetical protein ACT4YP_20875 (plasmid) [Acinetobacter baumannii]